MVCGAQPVTVLVQIFTTKPTRNLIVDTLWGMKSLVMAPANIVFVLLTTIIAVPTIMAAKPTHRPATKPSLQHMLESLTSTVNRISNSVNEMKDLLTSQQSESTAKSSSSNETLLLDKLDQLIDQEKQNMENMTKIVLSKPSCQCGEATDKKSESPSPVAAPPAVHRVPWLAGIYVKYQGKFMYACGGALIEKDLVLASATCISANDNPATLAVILAPIHGDFQANVVDHDAIKSKVAEIRFHPDYTRGKFTANLVLLKLEPQVKDSESNAIRPISVATDAAVPGEISKVRGFYYGGGGKLSDLVTEQVTMVEPNVCIQKLGVTVPDDQFCAVASEDPAPLRLFGNVAFVSEDGGRRSLKGLLNQSMQNKGFPVTFTSVPKFASWIKSTFGEKSNDDEEDSTIL